MAKALSVIDVIAAEAGGKTRADRLQAMKDVASAIVNRALQTGESLESIVSAEGQFDAYDKDMPAGTAELRDLAQEALNDVVNHGPTHAGTFYARTSAIGNLPPGLEQVGVSTDDHVYFSDPLNRAIATAAGFKKPSVGLEEEREPTAEEGVIGGGTAGAQYADLVAPTSVQTTTVSTQPQGAGLAALAPHGLLGDSTISTYDRANLDPSLGPVMDAVGADPRFADVGVNSGYRSPIQNRQAGGAKKSQHIQGRALDLDIRGLDDQDRAALLDKALTEGVRGVGLYSSGNTMHIDTRANPAFWGPGAEAHAGVPVSTAPAWAQPMLGDLMQGGGVYTPRFDAPIPDPRPLPPAEQLIASAPLPPVEQPQTVAPLAINPETVQPLGLLGDTVQPSQPSSALAAITSMLSPVSSAQAAEAVPSEIAASIPAAETIVGKEVAPPVSTFPARPEFVASAPKTATPAPTVATPAISTAFAPETMTPSEWGAFASLQPGTISPVQTAETVAPVQQGLGTNGTLFSNPIHALAETVPAGIVAPEITKETLSPLQTASVAPAPTASLAALPDVAPPLSGPVTVSDMKVAGIPGQPSPNLTSPSLLGPASTFGPPQQSGTFPAPPDPTKAFPAAPAPPTRLEQAKQSLPSAMKRAALGAMFGGIPGAAVGLASGLLGNQISRDGLFGPGFDSLVTPNERFSVGAGLKGMQAAMGGPKGATATASNGSTYTSLGPGKGGLRHSARFGWTEVVGPDGETKGITYGPTGGGLLGDLSRSIGGMFGGSDGGLSEAGKAAIGGSPGGLY